MAAVSSNARLGDGWVLASSQPPEFNNPRRRPYALSTARTDGRVKALEDDTPRHVDSRSRASRFALVTYV